MTDKQIIIDGVDVSGCTYYANGKCTNSHMLQSNCKNVAVCYYKEYKRKEQECEELKEEVAKARMETCNQCGERDDYNIPCKQIRDLDYGLQLEIEENSKLKATLTEIKNKLTVHKTLYYESKLIEKLHKQILQKISEVEDE